MKYMWSSKNFEDSVNMKMANDDFVLRTEYNLKMMDNVQKTSPKKVKRFRSAFTTDQVNYLEEQFKKFPYIGNAQRKEVAIALNIPERAVKIWFQNRRMKEKKETNTKEFDDEQNNRKSLEFAKDHLNNVNTPSANEQKPYSLSLLSDVNKNSDKIILTNSSPSTFNSEMLVPNSGYKSLENGMFTNLTYVPPFGIKPPQPILSTSYPNSAEFSIDLYKKYKTESISPTIVQPLAKEQDIKPVLKHLGSGKVMEQVIPEDLSASRKMNVVATSQAQLPNMPSNNPGYISVIPTVSPFYTQPYYAASGLLWKPVNMMPTTPAASATTPVSVPSSVASSVPEALPKKCCSCDCHTKPVLPYNLQQPSPSPQYIITAVQLPNPSAPKF